MNSKKNVAFQSDILGVEMEQLSSNIIYSKTSALESIVGNKESFCNFDNPLTVNLGEKLAIWRKINYITHTAFSQLLKILKESGLDVPNDCRTLLKTPRTVIIPRKVFLGEYYHLGLSHFLIKYEKYINLANEIEIDINIDGLPLSKSSQLSLWPILGTIVASNIRPFIIGAYIGNQKSTYAPIDFKTCVKTIMGSLSGQYLGQIFNKIIGDNALLEFNWNGSKGKKSFINLKRLSNGIYDAIKSEHFGISEFEEQMRKIILKAHKRIPSINFRKREKIKQIPKLL